MNEENYLQFRKFIEQRLFNDNNIGRDINIDNFISVIGLPENQPQQKQYSNQSINHNCPQPDFVEFIGRKQEQTKILEKLRPYPYSTISVITIDGIGGIGKSALALEIARRFLHDLDNLSEEEQFKAIVWTSAKQTILRADRGIVSRHQKLETLNDICETISRTLGIEKPLPSQLQEKVGLVCRELKKKRTLLIVDNLETIDDEAVIEFLQDLLPAPTKAIVTTRHKIDVAYPIRLLGMPLKDAMILIDKECQKKEVILNYEQKEKLYKRTGGVPLAIVWTIAKIGLGSTVNTTLAKLGNPQSDIARFCFQETIQKIRNKDSYKLLLALALYRGNLNREELGYIAGFDKDEFSRDDGLEELNKLSLINKKGAQFNLLPLTREYSNSELNKYPNFKSEIANRLIQLKSYLSIDIPHNIPVSDTLQFVGRYKTIEQLHRILNQNDETIIASIQGIEGVGKTELAIQYSLIHLLLGTYLGGVCWLRAREGDIGLQIIDFSDVKLGLKSPENWDLSRQVQFCWSHWQEKKEGNILLVLDDVNDYSKVLPYLPSSPSRFKVIITSRLQLDTSQYLNLNVLTEEAALELLKQCIGEKQIEDQIDHTRELCENLSYLPLALNLVIRYIEKHKISLSEINRRLKEEKLNLKLADNHHSYTIELGIFAVIELSWKKLSKDTKLLAYILSLFAFAPIPWDLVKSIDIGLNEIDLENNRIELESLYVFQTNNKNKFQIHTIIREFFKKKLSKADQKSYLIDSFVQVHLEIAQRIHTLSYKSYQKVVNSFVDVIPHLTEVIYQLTDYLLDEDLLWMFNGLSRYYEIQSLYSEAEFLCKKCLSIFQERFGQEHLYIATSLNNLARLYFTQGKYKQAEPLYLQALALRTKLLGENNIYIATSLNNLAGLYFTQGKYEQAEPLYLQALQLRKRLLGEQHPDTATTLDNLAVLYEFQGKYKEAETYYLQVLELRRRLLGEDPDVAVSMNNLAGLHSSQGRYKEAEDLYLQVLELRRKLLGDQHTDTANTMNNLAYLYFSTQRYEKAEPLYLQALDLNRNILGQEHPSIATTLNNLAYLYFSTQRQEEAEPLYLQALELRKKLLGEQHPDTAISLNNLADLYRSQGRFREAKNYYQEALEVCKQKLGLNHRLTVKVVESLAQIET